jgi:hypothetical protein
MICGASSYFEVLNLSLFHETTFINLLLPENILAYFEYEHSEEKSRDIRIHPAEKKNTSHYPKTLTVRTIQAIYMLINLSKTTDWTEKKTNLLIDFQTIFVILKAKKTD